ncbi:MAG: type II secretion system protein N [Proteobacteria bacterium]|nr:type II secretion system protein N [Pseudomonadota bacterium]MDA0993859.1 type II secretion system protein N [Pseudomonadota bacterium]
MKRYILAGLLVFLGVLVSTFPARVAYNWFAPADMHLTGISGSIWNGNAVEALAAGAYIEDISWRLKPASIFSGQLEFSTSAKPAAGTVTTDVGVSLSGVITLSMLSGRLPLNLVHPAIQQNGISGDVNLDFNRLVIRDGLPIDANGTITVSNFFMPDLSSARLGDYTLKFSRTDAGIVANLDDVSGVLDVSGTITLSAEKDYQLIGEVAARTDAPPSVQQQLQFLGTPDERGFRAFRFEGSL